MGSYMVKKLFLIHQVLFFMAGLHAMAHEPKQQLSRFNLLRYAPRKVQQFVYPTIVCNSINEAILKSDLEYFETRSAIGGESIAKSKSHHLTVAGGVMSQRSSAITNEEAAQNQPGLITNWSVDAIIGAGALYGLGCFILKAKEMVEPHIVGSLIRDSAELQPISDLASSLKKSSVALAMAGIGALGLLYLKNKLTLQILRVEHARAVAIHERISNTTNIAANSTSR